MLEVSKDDFYVSCDKLVVVRDRDWSLAYELLPLNESLRPIVKVSPTISGLDFIYGTAVSLRKGRIAWVVGFQREPFASRVLGRWLPVFRRKPESRIGIWVADLGGSTPREIGSFVRQMDEDGPIVRNLQWLPSGQALSFLYSGSLYRLPVN